MKYGHKKNLIEQRTHRDPDTEKTALRGKFNAVLEGIKTLDRLGTKMLF